MSASVAVSSTPASTFQSRASSDYPSSSRSSVSATSSKPVVDNLKPRLSGLENNAVDRQEPTSSKSSSISSTNSRNNDDRDKDDKDKGDKPKPSTPEALPPSNTTTRTTASASIPSTRPDFSKSTLSCRRPSDCQNKLCISGTCVAPSTFSTSIITVAQIPSSTSASDRVLFASATQSGLPTSTPTGATRKKSSGSITACSNAICTISPDLAELNNLEGMQGDSDQAQRALSSAAISGVVMAILFLTLALLLIIPSIREKMSEAWTRRKERKSGTRVARLSGFWNKQDSDSSISSATDVKHGYEKERGVLGNFRSNKPKRGFSTATAASFTCAQGDIGGDGMVDHWRPGTNVPTMPEVKIVDASPMVGARSPLLASQTMPTLSYIPHSQSVRTSRASAHYQPQSLKQARRTVLPYTLDLDHDLKGALAGLQNLGSPMLDQSQVTDHLLSTPTLPSSLSFGSAPPTPDSAYSSVMHTRPHTQAAPSTVRLNANPPELPRVKVTAPSSSSRSNISAITAWSERTTGDPPM